MSRAAALLIMLLVLAGCGQRGGSSGGGSLKPRVARTALRPPTHLGPSFGDAAGTVYEVGQTLTASTGTWTNNPTTFAYQWTRCNSSGASCSDISGAASASYTLGSDDASNRVAVTVRATSASESATQTSALTGIIKSSTQTDCIKVPSACGFPDATNTGLPSGTTLTPRSGAITVTTPGTTIANVALTGTIYIKADNVTVKDSDVTVDGTQTRQNAPAGGRGIYIESGYTGAVIEDTACHGGARSGNDVTEFCIVSDSSTNKIERVYAYNCTTCFDGPGQWSDSYVNLNGLIPQEHYEDLYYGGGDPGGATVNHDTLLNPQSQTAVVFASVDFGNQTTLTITNSLMTGGGYVIYGGGSGNGGKVLGPVTVTGNRFSRLYYPKGGYYGVAAYFNEQVTTWSGNIWDDTLQAAPG